MKGPVNGKDPVNSNGRAYRDMALTWALRLRPLVKGGAQQPTASQQLPPACRWLPIEGGPQPVAALLAAVALGLLFWSLGFIFAAALTQHMLSGAHPMHWLLLR